MMKVFCDAVLQELRAGLDAVELDEAKPKQALAARLVLVDAALQRLNEYRSSNGFKDRGQEIWYYKSVFPEFYALAEYFRLKYELIVGEPAGGGKGRRRYYGRWLKRVADFFAVFGFYFDYYLGETELLDEVLYTCSDRFNVLQPVLAGVDWSSGTAMGHLVGMFKAHERLREELLQQSYGLQGTGRSASLVDSTGQLSLSGDLSRFRWKGEVINLIELAHGIYLTGQLEQGVGIVEFFKALGDFFGVNLRVPKRGFDHLKKLRR